MGGQTETPNRVAAGGTPADDRFVIHTPKGDVAVIDFRKHPVLVTEDRQTFVIEDKTNFQIVFNVADTSFIITVKVSRSLWCAKKGKLRF